MNNHFITSFAKIKKFDNIKCRQARGGVGGEGEDSKIEYNCL